MKWGKPDTERPLTFIKQCCRLLVFYDLAQLLVHHTYQKFKLRILISFKYFQIPIDKLITLTVFSNTSSNAFRTYHKLVPLNRLWSIQSPINTCAGSKAPIEVDVWQAVKMRHPENGAGKWHSSTPSINTCVEEL